MNMDGKDVRKGVLLPLGAAGDAKARLASAGLTVMSQGEALMVVGVKFGSVADKLGVEQSFRITALEVAAQRPSREWFYIPALLLLGLVVLLQRARRRSA